MEGCEHLGIVEISSHIKGFRVLDRSVALHTGYRLERVINGGDTFAATEVYAFNFKRLDFLSFGTGALRDLNARITALAEVSGGHERVGRFLSCGGVRRADGSVSASRSAVTVAPGTLLTAFCAPLTQPWQQR